ncbi:MAG: CPBP family intramembrane metalloprotease [Acidobacteria bacterium]|nr:CPBP family intramembrane metalloprotease [Acidobacteriota bacterium]
MKFLLLTICGVLIFALTMTFVPLLPAWVDYAARAGLLLLFAGLWWVAREGHRLSRFRPVFFAYFAAVFSLSLGYFFADSGLRILGLTTHTPTGIAAAKCLQASLIVFGILVVAWLCGEDPASLYLRKGRLALGLSVGAITAAALLVLTLQQPAVRALGTARLLSLAPWILLFVVSNAFMEELLFRGLFLGRYESLIGTWPAILSTALAFTLAHLQVAYTPDLWGFLLVLLGFSIAWGWLMQKTASVWGSVLFHAGADLLIVLPIFGALGAA